MKASKIRKLAADQHKVLNKKRKASESYGTQFNPKSKANEHYSRVQGWTGLWCWPNY